MSRIHVLIVVITLAAVPTSGGGQILKTIKDQATKKIEDQKKERDSSVVHATVKVVDSTLAKTNRPVDTLLSRAGAVVDTSLNRGERAVTAEIKRLGSGANASDHIDTDIANGRVSLPELHFKEGTDTLDSTAVPILSRVAAAIVKAPGAFLIEGHVPDTGAPDAEGQLSQRRAAAVKGALIALGVPPDRLFAMGFGATRVPNGATKPVARIEVARMQ